MLSSSHVSNNNGSYSNERAAGFDDYGVDPASGGFFNSDFKKHDDLKEMLDSNKDSLKLEAMKRIIGMIAKGKDASVLFPAVVKNVVSKNIEVKKLVYVYLERYAEEQQDLALLSISTFQRALKEPNQLIRAGALRVLSSIRVRVISPIVMLAIRDSASDMSPYVRKTAAHAIPKLYALDNELKSELVTIIQKLLDDRTVLVIGSAVMAFTEVCPERIDLIHKVYRKLCALLVDVDEWGQVTIVNMLTRYARMQFADPNINAREDESDVPFYDDTGSDTSDKAAPTLDPDHRLLLRSTRPLLQSRNAAVVMAVAQLYHHVAPKTECHLTAKALVRLLRSHVEVQSVVLNAIASISAQNKTTFEQYLRSFFVRTSDPTNVKLLKLEIMTNLTNDSNVSIILRELETYISNSDKAFVGATIQAIGRCACSISEVTDTCLNGLVSLLSNRDEAVVAESVIVIKRLLQSQAADPKEIITHMAKLLDSITVAQARAAILWLLGEHCQKVPHIAPDILRKMAKSFPDEEEIVKLQIMNLAIKLYTTNPEQITILCRYIFKLARYDQNYDIRDKSRLLKQFLQNQNGRILSQASRIFLASKPAPSLKSRIEDKDGFQIGSLSHYINQIAHGYTPLPPFPDNPPPGDVRNVENIMPPQETRTHHKKSEKRGKDMFMWESGSSGERIKTSESESDDSDNSSSSSTSDDSQYEGSSTEDDESEKGSKSESSSESSSSSSEEESSSEDERKDKKSTNVQKNDGKKLKDKSEKEKEKEKSNLDLLLDLGDIESSTPVMVPSIGGFALPQTKLDNQSSIEVISALFTNTQPQELLNKITGKGLSATYRFTRSPHILSPTMTNINIIFSNNHSEDITDIKIGKKQLELDISIHEFASLNKLAPSTSLSATLGIDFFDTTKSAKFEIVCSLGNFNVSIKPPIGELLKPVRMSKELFAEKQLKLGGMYEHSQTIKETNNIERKIIEAANLGICDNSDPQNLKFCGQTLKFSNLVLVSVKNGSITINCENMVFGSVLLHELIHAIA